MLDYPQVALDFMNRDHAEFVSLRGKLLGLLSGQAPAAEVDTLLDELLEHTRHHFGEENRLMQETRFPPYPMHKGEHDHVLADMTERVTRWKQARDAATLQQWLEHDVGDWFVNHVSTMDFVTAGFIKAQGRG
ncbi:MAG TPA: hemerythrin family protein [Sideroxyarcus sp.]|nr:hemerythrin family protein [Sideroxyarcus sp.]